MQNTYFVYTDHSRNINMMLSQTFHDFFFTYDLDNKWLLKNPSLAYSIVALYLLFVLWIGPKYMKKREPFKMQEFLIVYNFMKAIIEGIIAFQIFSLLVENWDIRCNIKYNPRLPEIVKNSMKYAWYLYLTKYLDLLDTVFFVLRKKQSQVSVLHVFHHAGLCLLGSWGLKYTDAAAGYYIGVFFSMNTLIHSIMYSYYGLAACGPKLRKYLWWKKYLTIIQMSHIFVICLYLLVGFITGCEELGSIEIAGFTFAALNLILFLNFYRKQETYKKSS